MTERATAFMEKQKQAGKPFFVQMSTMRCTSRRMR